MDKPIFVDTKKKNINYLWGQNNNFTISMSGDGLKLDPDQEHYIALHSLRMSYTWNNIDKQKFNNNSLRYSKDGANWSTLMFPNGNYTYSDLSQYIQNYLESQSIEKDSIDIYYVGSLKKCFIELKNNIQVDFRDNIAFGSLIGFNNLVVNSSYGPLTPNITNSIDNVVIRCPMLISSSNFNGYQHDSVLYMFNTADHRIGYNIPIDEKNMIYNKINTNCITKFNVTFKDGLNRFIDLSETDIQMVLFIRSF